MPEATVLACRSCTAITWSTPSRCARTWSKSNPVGVSSSNTRIASRTNTYARGIIISAITPPATASKPSHPVAIITTAETITATEPSASLTTSRNAARMFMLSPDCARSTIIDPMLAASPRTPKNSSRRTSLMPSASCPVRRMTASTSA